MEVFKYTATGDRLPELQQNSTAQYNLSNKESRSKYWGPQRHKNFTTLYVYNAVHTKIQRCKSKIAGTSQIN